MRRGMERKLEQGIALVLALFLAASLCLAGILAARGVERWTEHNPVPRLVRAVKTRCHELGTLIGNAETYRSANLYLSAAADATVRFEYFPANDLRHFTALLKNKPDAVQIAGFEVANHRLSVRCTAPNEAALEMFAENLRSSGGFAAVGCETFLDAQGNAVGTVTCFTLLPE